MPILEQLKQRRIALGLKQHDMMLRAGISRQQYQRLESKGNPRLDTLTLVAKGLNSELMLIPQEKLAAVKAVLRDQTLPGYQTEQRVEEAETENSLANNPWQNMLEDDQ